MSSLNGSGTRESVMLGGIHVGWVEPGSFLDSHGWVFVDGFPKSAVAIYDTRGDAIEALLESALARAVCDFATRHGAHRVTKVARDFYREIVPSASRDPEDCAEQMLREATRKLAEVAS